MKCVVTFERRHSVLNTCYVYSVLCSNAGITYGILFDCAFAVVYIA